MYVYKHKHLIPILLISQCLSHIHTLFDVLIILLLIVIAIEHNALN